ncbi:hypothetical protein VTK56DRAFT_6817 [Thermocarpiscus australiensis]
MFGYLRETPEHMTLFNWHMSGYRQGRPSWMDRGFYPVEERLIKGAKADPDAPFLVDIAGGVGHDLDEFRRKVPHAPGRLMLASSAKIRSMGNNNGVNDSKTEKGGKRGTIRYELGAG